MTHETDLTQFVQKLETFNPFLGFIYLHLFSSLDVDTGFEQVTARPWGETQLPLCRRHDVGSFGVDKFGKLIVPIAWRRQHEEVLRPVVVAERVNGGDLSAVGWSEGPWSLVTPVLYKKCKAKSYIDSKIIISYLTKKDNKFSAVYVAKSQLRKVNNRLFN